jgi:P-type E1-E2 ATPase
MQFTSERVLRRALLSIALAGLSLGALAWILGDTALASRVLAAGTIPVVIGLAVSIAHDLWIGRMGVDAVAFVSMTMALLLGENLAAAVVAVMYAGGNLLEDLSVARAERDLAGLVDRAPRIAHRKVKAAIEDVPIGEVAVGDVLLVRAGEVIPVDGIILADSASIDEAALTGEPIPVTCAKGSAVQSGTINAGSSFELVAAATAGESTYAGVVKMVVAAQTTKAPFIRLADRLALVLLPATLLLAGGAWLISGEQTRALAVLVVSTPCPLIIAAPVAFIAGVSRAARLGILVKGGGPLEALARAHTSCLIKPAR